MSSASTTQDSTPTPSLFILIAMTALGPLALNIFIPSMPGLQKSLNTGYEHAQLTLTLYLVALALAQLVIGPLSDRFGRRPVLLAGTGLFIVASLGCAAAQTIDQLIAGRVFQATGGCAGFAIGRAIVRDRYDLNAAASRLGYINVGMVVAPMIAPVLGGFLDELGDWRLSFLATAIFGAAVFALVFFRLPETIVTRTNDGFRLLARKSAMLFREPLFMAFALYTAFTSSLFYTFVAGAPFIATEILGGSPSEFGIHYVLVSIGFMAGNFITGRLTERKGANLFMYAGTAVALVGLVVMILWGWADYRVLPALFVPMAIITFGNGMMIPAGLASAINVRPDIAGAAAGLMGFLQIGIAALATFALGLLHDGTRWPMMAVMCLCWLLAVVSITFAMRLNQQ